MKTYIKLKRKKKRECGRKERETTWSKINHENMKVIISDHKSLVL